MNTNTQTQPPPLAAAGSHNAGSEPQAPSPELTGKALIERNRAELKETLANRAERDDKWGVEDMLPIGTDVVHLASGEICTITGVKHQGGDRGYSLRIEDQDTGRVRHVRPWAVEELGDELVDDGVPA